MSTATVWLAVRSTNDRHPSLKLNEDYFFCFSCGAKGDVIDLVARLFDLSSYEAVQKLAADFELDPKPPTAAAMVKPKRPYIRQFREDEMLFSMTKKANETGKLYEEDLAEIKKMNNEQTELLKKALEAVIHLYEEDSKKRK